MNGTNLSSPQKMEQNQMAGDHPGSSASYNQDSKIEEYDDNQDSPPSASGGKKRRRVNVACVQCRERKVRCDGGQPRCGRCTGRGFDCMYTKKFARARVSVEYVRELEQKLGKLGEPEETDWAQASQSITPRQRRLTNSSITFESVQMPQSHEKLPSIDQHLMSVIPNHPQSNLHSHSHSHSHSHENVSPTNSFAPLIVAPPQEPPPHLPPPNYPPSQQNLLNFSPPVTTSPPAYTNGSTTTNSIPNSNGTILQPTPANLPPPPKPVNINSVDSTGTSHSTASSSRLPKHSSTSSAFGDGDPNTTADAMGATTTKSNTRRQDFYGSSSAMSFMKLVEAAVNAGKNRHTNGIMPGNIRAGSESDGGSSTGKNGVTGLYGNHRYRMTRAGGPGYYGREDWALPPRRLADHYIQCYFTYVYSLYPFIHQPTFMAAYNYVWTTADDNLRDEQHNADNANNSINSGHSEDSDDELNEGHMFYCIVNMVFAFGCLFSSGIDSSSRESSSQVYFDRAREHLNYDLLDAGDSGSLILLQALLLIGQYLQATQKPAACWNVVGLAIRVAQELGLYREQQISSRPSAIEQELCRRLWYGCILMDRIVAMTFGRPLMITQDFKVNPPSFVDDNYITESGIVTPPESSPPSILAFYQQTILLYDILSDILGNFYDTHDSDTKTDDELRVLILTNILETECRLSKFRNAIPPHLQIETVSQHAQSNPFRRQTNVLQARYLHLEIMLYRPILLPHTRGYKGKPSPLFQMADSYLQSTMEKTICKLCVMAAIRLIKLIFDNKDTPNLPAMWYCIFYVYTSASVLLAAKLQPTLEGELDSESMEAGWKMALQLLRLFERNGPSATRCLRILEVLHDKISSASHNESKPMFDFLPDLVDPVIEFGDDSSLLFTMMNDNTGPFSENTIEYHYADNPIGF